jgi:hypothetical protein
MPVQMCKRCEKALNLAGIETGEGTMASAINRQLRRFVCHADVAGEEVGTTEVALFDVEIGGGGYPHALHVYLVDDVARVHAGTLCSGGAAVLRLRPEEEV